MTAAEMLKMVEIVYESIASNNAPGYSEYEWSILLSEAQEEVIKNVIKEGAEKDDFNKLAIQTLSKRVANNTITTYPHIPYAFSVAQDVLSLNDVWAIYKEVINNSPKIKVKPISFDFYADNIKNPYKKPTEKLAWRIVTGIATEIIIVLPANTPLTSYELYYIGKPSPIIVPGTPVYDTIFGTLVTSSIFTNGLDCNLSTLVHTDIVHLAAERAKLYISDLQGWQAHLAQIKK
jgi:hypothetical protein